MQCVPRRRPDRGGARALQLLFATLLVAAPAAFVAIAQDLPLPDAPIRIEGKNGVLNLEETRRVRLDESLVYLSDANGLEFYVDGSFVVVSSDVASVVLYDANGRQRRILGSWGPGPKEYLTPRLASVEGSNVFIYDSAQGKYLAYDSTGRAVGEWKGTRRSPTDMLVRGSWIYGLMAQSRDFMIEGFDTASTDTLVEVPTRLDIGVRNVVLGPMRFGLNGDRIHFAYADRNAIQSMDLATGAIQSLPLPTAGFRQAEMPFKEIPDINEAMFDGRLLDYVMTNSRVDGVDVLDDYVVALRSDGEWPMAEDVLVPSGRLRTRRLFVHDRMLQFVDLFEIDFEMLRTLGLSEAGTNGNAFYYVVDRSRDDGRTVEWDLIELSIRPAN